MSNILEQANEIINNRSEEKERQYGPMGAGFERAAMIASGMSGKEWSANDMFIAMIALKFSRQSYNFKEDNLLDAVAYIGAWQNYINENKPDHAGPDTHEEITYAKKDVKKELLTEENDVTKDFCDQENDESEKSFEEEDTQDSPVSVAQSPYALPITDPRALIKALTSLGEK